MSVKRKVTVPVGRSVHTTRSSARHDPPSSHIRATGETSAKMCSHFTRALPGGWSASGGLLVRRHPHPADFGAAPGTPRPLVLRHEFSSRWFISIHQSATSTQTTQRSGSSMCLPARFEGGMDQGSAAGHLGDGVVVADREQVCDAVTVGVVAEDRRGSRSG